MLKDPDVSVVRHPSENYYLFTPNWQQNIKACQMADFVFGIWLDIGRNGDIYRIEKKRTIGPFLETNQYAWLKNQYPSIEYFSDVDGGEYLGVYDSRDRLLIKLFHDAERCLNRVQRG